MLSRLAWLLLSVFCCAALCSCTPSGERVKEEIVKKSLCSVDDYRLTGSPTKDNEGYVYYNFVATIECKDPSFYVKKYSERTRVSGKAEMLGEWFGLRHKLSRYEFTPQDDE